MQKSQYGHSGIQLLGAINVWGVGMDMAALLSYGRQRSQLLLHWLDSSLGYDLICSVFCPVTVLIFAFFLWRKIEIEKRYVGS